MTWKRHSTLTLHEFPQHEDRFHIPFVIKLDTRQTHSMAVSTCCICFGQMHKNLARGTTVPNRDTQVVLALHSSLVISVTSALTKLPPWMILHGLVIRYHNIAAPWQPQNVFRTPKGDTSLLNSTPQLTNFIKATALSIALR